MSAPALKAALEDLLRARRLQLDGPPLRGEDRRGTRLSTGIAGLDALLGGGLPRGQVSEVHGPASSGRTAVALSAAARRTRDGALVAWIDPLDRLDPSSAAEAGLDLARVLWLRGRPRDEARALTGSVAAASAVVGSGLFELVVLDLAGASAPLLRRLPLATWLRLQRTIELQPSALLVAADHHVACGPLGVSLAARGGSASWSGAGPGRLLRGREVVLAAGRDGRQATIELRASA